MIVFYCGGCGKVAQPSDICKVPEDNDIHCHFPEGWWYADHGDLGYAVYCSKQCRSKEENKNIVLIH